MHLGLLEIYTCLQLMSSRHTEVLRWECLFDKRKNTLTLSQPLQNFEKENCNPLAANNILWNLLHCLKQKSWQCDFREGCKNGHGHPSTEPNHWKSTGLYTYMQNARIHILQESPLDRVDLLSKNTFRMNNERISTSP